MNAIIGECEIADHGLLKLSAVIRRVELAPQCIGAGPWSSLAGCKREAAGDDGEARLRKGFLQWLEGAST